MRSGTPARVRKRGHELRRMRPRPDGRQAVCAHEFVVELRGDRVTLLVEHAKPEQTLSSPKKNPRLPLHVASSRAILNPMVQYTRARLDASFAVLSDATRRGVLEQLGRSDASITDLAGKFHMTLTGMKKHVGVLERAGLVTTQKVGRVRTCKLGTRRFEAETAWLERYHQLWDSRFIELDKVVEELERKEKTDGRKPRR